MSDRERRLRELLEGYRGRVAAVTLEMPELEKLVALHGGGGGAAVAQRPALAERPAAEPAPAPKPVWVPPPRRAPRAETAEHHPAPPPVVVIQKPAPAKGLRAARAAWLAATLAAVLAGALGWARFENLQKQKTHGALALPLSSSVGLAQRGGVFFSLDRTRGLLGAVDPATKGLVSLKRFPNSSASGLAASPEKLWSAGADGFVYEHGFQDGYPVLRTFANPDRRPSALHWDGAHLWIADSRTNSIYEYTAGAALVPTRQFTLPSGLAPVGLHVDNGLIWVLDAGSRTIYRFGARGLLEPADSLNLQSWIAAPRQPTGMIVLDQVLWISVDGPPELHRFDLRLLAWRPG